MRREASGARQAAGSGGESPQELLARVEAGAERLVTRTDGRATVWRRWGEGGDILVLLHGGYGSWRHWVRNVEALSQRRTVLVADLPGLGDSDDVPEPITPERVAAFTADGLRSLLPDDRPFDLAGFSFGSTIGGLVHEQLADRIRSLTLVGAGALGLERTNIVLIPLKPELSEEERRAANRANLLALMIADPAAVDDLALRIQDENLRLARVPTRHIVPRGALAAALQRRPARRLNAIWGGRDAVVGNDMASREAYVRTLPNSTFTSIPGAGHWVSYEAAEEFNRAMVRLLAG